MENELLKLRYIVVADYPESLFTIGNIYTYDVVDEELQNVNNIPTYHKVKNINKYHHIFRPLAWYEHREEKDMPEYLKRSNKIIKVKRWQFVYGEWKYDFYSDGIKIKDCPLSKVFYSEPATLSDYENFKQQNKSK